MSDNTAEGKEHFPHGQSSTDLQDADAEELLKIVEEQLAETERLRDHMNEIEEDMVHVDAVEVVLQEYGLSMEQAAEVVQTIREVNAGLQGEDDE